MYRSDQKKHYKFGFLFALVMLITLLLSACAEVRLGSADEKDLFLQIENASCTKKEAIYLLMEEKSAYEEGQTAEGFWNRPVGDISMGEYVKNVVKDKLTRYTAAEVMSDTLAAYPTEDAKNQAGEDAVASWTKISVLYDVDSYEITASDVNNLYYKKAVYDAVYNKITTDAVQGITEDSTRVMLADYVVIPQSAGEEVATQILNSVRNGEEFSKAADIAGYPIQKSQMIRRGELNSAVDTIAFALVDGEWSEVVESKDNFYIIHCLDDNLVAESAANLNEILANTKEKAFKEAYYSFSQDSKLWMDEKFFEQLDLDSIK